MRPYLVTNRSSSLTPTELQDAQTARTMQPIAAVDSDLGHDDAALMAFVEDGWLPPRQAAQPQPAITAHGRAPVFGMASPTQSASAVSRALPAVAGATTTPIEVRELRKLRPLAAVQTLLPTFLLPFSAYREPQHLLAPTRFSLGSSFALIQADSLNLPLHHHGGVISTLPTGEPLFVVAGRNASHGSDNLSVAADASLTAAKMVSGSLGVTLLLWHDDKMTALHCTKQDTRAPWRYAQTTVQKTDATEAYLLRRPGQAPLGVQGMGNAAQLYLGR